MTPFNPTALLVMLLTFYPIVSPAELARARRERPDAFAGGVLGGSHGDKMTLPDGRVWDLIYDVENATGRRHWQVIQPGDGGGGDPLFPLEPGPLTPIDEAQWPRPTPDLVFLPLVAGALAELAGDGPLLDTAQLRISEHASPAALEAVFGATIGPAAGGLDEQLRLMYLATPDDVLQTTQSHGGAIDANTHTYDEPVAPDVPIDNPGLPPGGPEYPE